MKGLVGYHLLNAAAFPNSSCAVDGHFQFIGTNGNGKTTNLRIPLYFYNPSGLRPDHAIEKSKRAFNDFYFRGQHSFIIFEICRGTHPDGSEDRYHVAVNRKGGRPPSFTFIDAPYQQDFYASIAGKICDESELLKNIVRHGISSQVVHGYEDFKGIIYGTNVNERFRPYVFAIPKHSAIKSIYTIPRILSSIFRSETMKTETLKDALIASLGIEEDQLNIDLHNTGKELKQFNAKRSDVQHIEGMRNRLKLIVDDFRSYQSSQTAMHSLACKIKSALPKVELAIQTNSAAKNTAQQEITNRTETFKQGEEELQQQQAALDEQFGRLDEKQKTIKELQRKNPQELISKWEHSEQEVPQTATKLRAYEEELTILNQRFAEVETKYENLEKTLNNAFTSRRQSYEIAKGNTEKNLNEELNQIHSNRRQQLLKLEQSSKEQKIALTAEKSDADKRCTEFKQTLDSLELHQFRKAEIQEITQALQTFSKQQTENEHALQAMPDKAKVIEQEYIILENELRDRYNTLLRSQRAELEALEIQMEKERPLVERYQDSLLDHADQLNFSSEALRSVVREEVLLMPSHDILKEGDSPEGSLLGLQLNLEQLPSAPELNYEQAKLRLDELEQAHEKQSQQLAETEEADRKAKEEGQLKFQQARGIHRKKLDKLREEATTLSTEIETQTRALEAEQRQQTEAYQTALKNAKEEHTQAKEDLINTSEKLNQFESEQTKCVEEIEGKAKEAIQLIEEQIDKLETNLKAQLEELEKEHTQQSSDLQAKKQKELQDGASDPEQLESIKQKHSETKAQLEGLQKDVTELESYRKHVLPQIQQLPELLESLKIVNQSKSDCKSDQIALQVKKEKELKSLNDTLRHHTTLHGNAQKDNETFQSWEKTFPRFEAIEENSLLTTYIPGDLQTLNTRFRDESTASEQLWNGTKDSTSNDYRNRGIAHNARKIIKPFLTNNLYGFPEQLESDSEIEEFIQQKVDPLITTDVIERERKQILNAFLLTMKNISSDYGDMERHKSQLQRTLSGVQKSITGKKIFVSAIENIEFRMEPSKSKFGTLRDNLKACIDKLDTLNLAGSAQDDLFQRHPDSREIQVLLDQVQTLCNEISDHKIDRISLGDLFEMQIRITENGNIHPWRSSVQGIGSEGTDTLAKVMIYVGILSHFKSAAFKNADELHLHCLVDEIGRIHSDYISELLHFCNERGIFLATASPESHRRPGDFQNTYLIERSADQRQAMIRKVLQVGVSVA
tara:strand:+ start:7867 stop:11613 length:3747 start_codon:yes stop_codon:yes gene_type:complete